MYVCIHYSRVEGGTCVVGRRAHGFVVDVGRQGDIIERMREGDSAWRCKWRPSTSRGTDAAWLGAAVSGRGTRSRTCFVASNSD